MLVVAGLTQLSPHNPPIIPIPHSWASWYRFVSLCSFLGPRVDLAPHKYTPTPPNFNSTPRNLFPQHNSSRLISLEGKLLAFFPRPCVIKLALCSTKKYWGRCFFFFLEYRSGLTKIEICSVNEVVSRTPEAELYVIKLIACFLLLKRCGL